MNLLMPVTKEMVIAAAKTNYMDPMQLEFFRSLIVDALETAKAILEAREETIEEAIAVPDENDRASIIDEASRNHLIKESAYKTIRMANNALERIEEGTYGYCEESGDEIGIPRLLANPLAERTIEIQQRIEFNSRMLRPSMRH